MKRIILSGVLILTFAARIYAQNGNANPNASGASWQSNGNAATTNSFIGTTNSQSLIFKTQNIQRGMFDLNGKFIIGGTEGGGGIDINPSLLHRPTLINPIPQFMLKVGGDGFFEGKVDMLQGFIKEYLSVKGVITGPRIDIDSIKMDSTRGIYGTTRVFGDVQIKQNLTVDGSAMFNGSLTATKGLTFDGSNGIGFIPATATSGPIYRFGPASTFTVAPIEFNCPTPFPYTQYPQLYTTGSFISHIPAGSGTGQVNSSLRIYSAPWDGNGVIDVEGKDASGNGNNALLINFFCGRNTYINTNNGLDNRGGKVFMGEKVSMAKNLGIGYWNTGNLDENVSLNIYANNDNQTGIKINTYNGTVTPIQVKHPTTGTILFNVAYDGAIKSAHFAGGGVRSLLVDNDGNLMWGQQTTSSSVAWNLGGNTGTANQAIGTLDGNSDLPFLAGGNEKMRLTQNGSLIINRSPSNFGNSFSASMGSAAGANLNYGTSYLAFNSQRTSTSGSGSWSQYSDYSHNGAGIMFGDVFGTISFSTMPSTTTGTADATFTDADVMSHRVMRMSWNNTTGNGQIFIGNKTPQNAPFKDMLLSVSGSIVAQEIYVRDQVGAGWADYVFNKDYNLMPLAKVEEFIQANNHLPNVPSACEIEEKGQGIGQLQVVQMEKIEEAFLYILELKKEMEALKKDNEKLKAIVDGLDK